MTLFLYALGIRTTDLVAGVVVSMKNAAACGAARTPRQGWPHAVSRKAIPSMTESIPDLVDRLRALEAQATPGPWTRNRGTSASGRLVCIGIEGKDDEGTVDIADVNVFEGYEQEGQASAVLLTAARNAFPALLDLVEAAETLVMGEDYGYHVATCPVDETGTCQCYLGAINAALTEAVAALSGEEVTG